MKQLKFYFSIILILLFFGESGFAQNLTNLNYYKAANVKTGMQASGENRVVFMGNSITQGWSEIDPAFFNGKPYINSGISGQTTSQMLSRFETDVINFLPTVVVILAGTNDIAGNGGPTTVKKILGNIASMAQLAKTNGIEVVLCSVLPVYKYPWAQSVNPIDSISSLNSLLKTYAQENDMIYADFYSTMVNEQKGLKAEYSADGVHPNLAGYNVMNPIVEEAIGKAMLLAGIDPLVTQNDVVVTNITMSPTALSLDKNDSRQLYARLTPLNAISDITWSSTNESVATVNSAGLVTAKAAGNATITVTAANNNKTATCDVTVNDNGLTKFEAESATLSGVNLTKDQQGYSGTGFVAPFGNSGNYVQFSIKGATAGSQDIILRYATADGASIHLYVNGTLIRKVTLASTGSWGGWTDKVDNVTLNAGNNTIKYQKDADDGGYINVDYLALSNIKTGIIEISNNEKESDISLSPNPLSTGALSIKLPEGTVKIFITDAAGKIIYQKQVKQKEYLIDRSVFKSEGVYVVNVVTTKNSMNKKVIVIK